LIIKLLDEHFFGGERQEDIMDSRDDTFIMYNDQNQLPLTVGILIFDQVEVLDVAGPFEVFAITRLNEERRQEESSSPFKILLVSEKPGQVSAIGGLRFTPDVTIDNCPEELDLLIVPGGWGTRNEIKNVNLLKWIANRASKTRLTASVCTGSSLLGKSGLLDGREATTHWRAFDFLRQAAPSANIREDVRFTLAEPIFTSAGIFLLESIWPYALSPIFSELRSGRPRHVKWNILIPTKMTDVGAAILNMRQGSCLSN
jgi:putative intracellular protease/amidase